MKVEEVFDALMDEFYDWHSTFHSSDDQTIAHCCYCKPSLCDDEGKIVIDNRYPGYAEREVHEIWERDGVKVIIMDDDSNTVSFTPYTKLQELGFKLVENEEIEL